MDNRNKTNRYGKPCMTNLPPELGKSIFRQILTAPVPDERKLRASCRQILARLEKRIRQLEHQT